LDSQLDAVVSGYANPHNSINSTKNLRIQHGANPSDEERNEIMHDMELLITLGGGLGAALVLGYITHRLGLSPIVGYLLAGIVVGPNSPGFVANSEIAKQLAELGVILLMFGVGLHFDLGELSRVKRIAIPGALVQCFISFLAGLVAANSFGWSFSSSVVFGISIAFASTVVVMRVLADANEVQSLTGSVAIGWLIVQDVLAVLVLVLLPSMGGEQQLTVPEIGGAIAMTVLKIAIAVAAIIVIGGRAIPTILKHVAATHSRELFTLTVLVIVLGIAIGSSELFGVSVALGAFMAGVVVGQSDFAVRAATEALPMRDAFAVLFFVSIGMLFDPNVLVESLGMLLATLGIVMLITPFVCMTLSLSLGYPLELSLRVAFSLAQIGEFSFIISSLAQELQLIPAEVMQVLVAVSIASISISPILQRLVDPMVGIAKRSTMLQPLLVMREPFSKKVKLNNPMDTVYADELHRAVIVGYGPVGKTVARLLSENGVQPSIIEMNHATLESVRQAGFPVTLGDATHADTLKMAGIETSSSLILGASTIRGAEEVIRVARLLNPEIKVIVRAASLRERTSLLKSGANTVFSGESEVAMALAEYLLRDLGATPEQIDRERDRVRTEILG
jgi:CPA2 family monovalent cation:H+ antiporter-2